MPFTSPNYVMSLNKNLNLVHTFLRLVLYPQVRTVYTSPLSSPQLFFFLWRLLEREGKGINSANQPNPLQMELFPCIQKVCHCFLHDRLEGFILQSQVYATVSLPGHYNQGPWAHSLDGAATHQGRNLHCSNIEGIRFPEQKESLEN